MQEGRREAAARFGDGYVGTSPDPDLLGRFRAASDRPAMAGAKVAFADDPAIRWRLADAAIGLLQKLAEQLGYDLSR